MRNPFKTSLFICAVFLFLPQANAETYFLKIEQQGTPSQETFLQTCSAKTSPCTFMIPVELEKGKTKNIAVVMRIKESPYIYLQFYWDQDLLGTNNFREEYYTLLAGSKNAKTDPKIIELYAPLSSAQKPAKNELVMKYSDKPIANLKATAVLAKEKEEENTGSR